jgi:uncharacterized protein
VTAKQPKRKARAGVDGLGRTPLHYAAANGDVAVVTKLLAQGSDLNQQDDNGWSPLHFAAQAVSAPITELLLSAGANIDAKDIHGNTPLFRAVFSSQGQGSVISLLLKAGADPNASNNSGNSPRMLAHTIANFDVKQFFQDTSS